MTTSSRRELAWGLAAQMLSVGLWIIMLPAILRYLPPWQVALWLVFTTLAALAQLLELGFLPTIARNVAYVRGGATVLKPTGVDPGQGGPADPALMADLLAAARRIYRIVAVAAALVLWLGGTRYMLALVPAGEDKMTLVAAWLAFSAGYVVHFYFGYLNAFLQGSGLQLQANRSIVLSRLVQLAIGLLLIAQGYGLPGLGVASLAATVAGRWLALRAFRQAGLQSAGPVRPDRVVDLVRILWHNASRYGLVMLAAFLITRANILIASSRLGLVESVSFSLSLQVLLILQSIAGMPFNVALPRLNLLRAQGDAHAMRVLFGRSLVTSLALFIVAAIGLVLLGAPVLRMLGSNSQLLPLGLLLALCVVIGLELNHGICANLITTDNRVPFVGAGLITGVGIAVTAWLVAPSFGATGLVATIALWQLAYNNWRWPHQAARMLHTRYLVLVHDALRARLIRS